MKKVHARRMIRKIFFYQKEKVKKEKSSMAMHVTIETITRMET